MFLVQVMNGRTFGLHVDVRLDANTKSDERSWFERISAERKDTEFGQRVSRYGPVYTFFIENGDHRTQAEHELREWLESLPYVRLIVIEFYDTRLIE